jgi:transcriptional regulator with XRE-family HTH domain
MPRAMSKEKTTSEKVGSIEQLLLAFGERIRNGRKQKGLSQEDFAAECGLHRTEMGLLERGKTIPRLDTLLLVSQHPGLAVLELLRGIEP